MPSLPKIPISLTLKTLQVTHRQLAKHHKKWCFFIKAPINTFQHDWQLSPQCINYATLAAIFTNSVSGKKKVLMSSGKGVFTFIFPQEGFRVLFCFSRKIQSRQQLLFLCLFLREPENLHVCRPEVRNCGPCLGYIRRTVTAGLHNIENDLSQLPKIKSKENIM